MSPSQSLLRTGRSVLLIGGTRLIGLCWPILLTSHASIGLYGRFAVLIALSTLITTPLDAYYVVRAPRASTEDFTHDQASRVWTGSALLVIGVAVWSTGALAGFAISKAGLDIMFNARKSWAIRTSRPDRALTEDGIRQAASLLTCAVVLAATGTHSLDAVGLCYLVGYLPFAALVARTVARTRPRLPERSRVTGFLTAEAVVGVLYAQGDVILLGWLLPDAQVGYYSLGSQVAQTAGAIGQSYATTFHDELRAHDGAVTAGPRLRHTWIGAAACAVLVAIVAAGLLTVGAPRALWLTFLVFSTIAATRFSSAVFTTVLALQHRDLFRLTVSVVALGVKLAAVTALAHWGGAGAALGFLLGELVLAGTAQRVLYAGAPRPVVPA